MFTFRSTFCPVLLLFGFSVNAVGQVDPVFPYTPFSLGTVGVKDGQFFVEEYYYEKEQRTQTQSYTVSVPYQETQTQTYTVEVPYTVELPDKTQETRTRTEQRAKEVTVMKYRPEERTREVTVTVPFPMTRLIPVADEMISFSNLAGKRITNLETVRKLLQKESRPALIKFDPNPVNERYHQALNRNLVVVHLDRTGMASNAWNTVIRGVARVDLDFHFVPVQEYSRVVALQRRWQVLDYQPSPEDVQNIWKTHGPKDKEITDEDIASIKTHLRAERFRNENEQDLRSLIKAAWATIYKQMVAAGNVNPKSAASFVFVPLPCPSKEVYEMTSSFIQAACDVAEENDLSVVIARSYYGKAESVSQPLQAGEAWNDEILKLPERYSKYLESGTLKIVDSFPGVTSTPVGILFRGGELVLDGVPAKCADNPLPILKEFKP